MATRIMLVDPQPFFCGALADALTRRGVEIVGWTTDEIDAERLVSKRTPDLVLSEVDLADGSGLRLARHLEDHTRVVILTRRAEGEVLLDAAAAGAVGCVSHDVRIDALANLLDDAMHGRFAIEGDRLRDALVVAAAAHGKADGRAVDRLHRLTSREHEVARMVAEGQRNDDIARQLFLSANTVRTHVGNIRRKLEVHSRADLARLYLDATREEVEADVVHISGPELPRDR